MSWTFAIVNNRLAEVFFDKEKDKIVFRGHCYVERREYKTKQEQKMIKDDTDKYRFTYRNGKYFDQNNPGSVFLSKKFEWS